MPKRCPNSNTVCPSPCSWIAAIELNTLWTLICTSSASYSLLFYFALRKPRTNNFPDLSTSLYLVCWAALIDGVSEEGIPLSVKQRIHTSWLLYWTFLAYRHEVQRLKGTLNGEKTKLCTMHFGMLNKDVNLHWLSLYKLKGPSTMVLQHNWTDQPIKGRPNLNGMS